CGLDAQRNRRTAGYPVRHGQEPDSVGLRTTVAAAAVKGGCAMTREHERIKEEVTLLALGMTPDIPVTAVVDHAAECAECRQLMRDVYETAGRIPETLPDTDVPAHVRDSILQRVRA